MKDAGEGRWRWLSVLAKGVALFGNGMVLLPALMLACIAPAAEAPEYQVPALGVVALAILNVAAVLVGRSGGYAGLTVRGSSVVFTAGVGVLHVYGAVEWGLLTRSWPELIGHGLIVILAWATLLAVLRPPTAFEIDPELCGVCGYDLRGSRGGVCPECGATR